jgi:DNA-binding PadR family transcriptional regulator
MALALMALLMPGDPMHPYQMANVLRRTGKDHDMKIKWGSLYTVVQNLEKNGFIEATTSHREGRRPERTLYALTDAGREELRDWLRELVATPEPEFPHFKAALSVLSVLTPDEAIELLGHRHRALNEQIAVAQADLDRELQQVPRLFLVEAEYDLAMRRAEAEWVAQLLKELTEGTLYGVAEWRAYHAGEVAPPGWVELLNETK